MLICVSDAGHGLKKHQQNDDYNNLFVLFLISKKCCTRNFNYSMKNTLNTSVQLGI